MSSSSSGAAQRLVMKHPGNPYSVALMTYWNWHVRDWTLITLSWVQWHWLFIIRLMETITEVIERRTWKKNWWKYWKRVGVWLYGACLILFIYQMTLYGGCGQYHAGALTSQGLFLVLDLGLVNIDRGKSNIFANWTLSVLIKVQCVANGCPCVPNNAFIECYYIFYAWYYCAQETWLNILGDQTACVGFDQTWERTRLQVDSQPTHVGCPWSFQNSSVKPYFCGFKRCSCSLNINRIPCDMAGAWKEMFLFTKYPESPSWWLGPDYSPGKKNSLNSLAWKEYLPQHPKE